MKISSNIHLLIVFINLFLIFINKCDDNFQPTNYAIIDQNLSISGFKKEFKKHHNRRIPLILNPNRSSTFYRVGTLLNHYDLTEVDTTLTIPSRFLSFLESYDVKFKQVLNATHTYLQSNETNKEEFKGFYQVLQKQFTSLAGKVNVMIDSIKFYESPRRVIELERKNVYKTLPKKSKRDATVAIVLLVFLLVINWYFEARASALSEEALDQAKRNKEAVQKLEGKVNKLENAVNAAEKIIEDAANGYMRTLAVLTKFSSVIEDLYGMYGNLTDTMRDISETINIQQEQIRLMSYISQLNTFMAFLQEILDDLDVINSGDVTIKPLLQHLAKEKLNQKSVGNVNGRTLLKMLLKNLEKENLPYKSISDADLLNRYLVSQYAVVIINDYGLTITYKSSFIDFLYYKIPLLGIYAINQYLKITPDSKNISEIYMPERLPDLIAVDPNLQYFVSLKLRDYEICSKRTFVVCPMWLNIYNISNYKCVEQLFYFDMKNVDINETCGYVKNYNIHSPIVQISSNQGWDILENQIVTLGNNSNNTNCKDFFSKGFATENTRKLCVQDAIKFYPLDIVQEISLRILSISSQKPRNFPNAVAILNEIRNFSNQTSKEVNERIKNIKQISSILQDKKENFLKAQEAYRDKLQELKLRLKAADITTKTETEKIWLYIGISLVCLFILFILAVALFMMKNKIKGGLNSDQRIGHHRKSNKKKRHS